MTAPRSSIMWKLYLSTQATLESRWWRWSIQIPEYELKGSCKPTERSPNAVRWYYRSPSDLRADDLLIRWGSLWLRLTKMTWRKQRQWNVATKGENSQFVMGLWWWDGIPLPDLHLRFRIWQDSEEHKENIEIPRATVGSDVYLDFA